MLHKVLLPDVLLHREHAILIPPDDLPVVVFNVIRFCQEVG